MRLRSRLLGLFVLLVAVGGTIVLTGEDASPWSWMLVAIVGFAGLVASVANFGDRFDVREDGITHWNVLVRGLGLVRERQAPWAGIRSAIDQDGETFFLEVDGQRRWVLDQLDGHEHLRVLLAERGVPTTERRRPRLTGWGRGGVDAPR